jgi:hypothetical protein
VRRGPMEKEQASTPRCKQQPPLAGRTTWQGLHFSALRHAAQSGELGHEAVWLGKATQTNTSGPYRTHRDTPASSSSFG